MTPLNLGENEVIDTEEYINILLNKIYSLKQNLDKIQELKDLLLKEVYKELDRRQNIINFLIAENSKLRDELNLETQDEKYRSNLD